MKRTVTQIRLDELERFDKVIEAVIEPDLTKRDTHDLLLMGVRAELARRKRQLRRRIKEVTK